LIVEFRYAGFWIRVVATVIDWIVLGVAAWLPSLFLPSSITGLHLQIVESVIEALLSTGYFVWGHYKYQTTLGKRALRLYVVRADNGLGITLKQSWIRAAGYILSYAPLACGYILAGINPRKQALHDLIAGTVVVRQTAGQSGK